MLSDWTGTMMETLQMIKMTVSKFEKAVAWPHRKMLRLSNDCAVQSSTENKDD